MLLHYKMDVLLYKGLQLANPEFGMNVTAKDIKTDRLDDVDAVRQRKKKLAVIYDKERHGSGRVLVVRIVLKDW